MNVFQGKNETSPSDTSPLWRHIWIGAAIGLYFGWFFRPVREPSLVVVVFLALVITAVLAAWQLFRRQRLELTAGQILRRIPFTYLQYAIILSVLEARHFAFDWGGRFAVIGFTTVLGALFGGWIAYRKFR